MTSWWRSGWMPTSAPSTCDADQQMLTLASTIGLLADSVGRVVMPFGEGLVGLAAERGEPIALEHAQEDPHYSTSRDRRGASESFMAAPLIVRGGVIGVIAVRPPRPALRRARHRAAPDLRLAARASRRERPSCSR
ncbi:MAG: GAF domain-containing protein [Myxococcota bacterium]